MTFPINLNRPDETEPRRIAKFFVSPELLAQVFLFEPGHKIEAVMYDADKQTFVLRITGPSIPECRPGWAMETITPWYETIYVRKGEVAPEDIRMTRMQRIDQR